MKNCSTCRYWSEFINSTGFCRSKPPSGSGESLNPWPRTSADAWCGGYRSVPPAPKEGGRPKAIKDGEFVAAIAESASTEAGALTAAFFADKFHAKGMSKPTFYRYLHRLLGEGRIVKVGSCYYAPPVLEV